MSMTRAFALAFALAATVASAARAQEAVPTVLRPASDAPATTPATPVATLDADRDRYDDRGPGPLIGPCGPTGPNAKGDGPDHKAHGEVMVGAGTRGYREVGAVVCQPIGDHTAVTIAVDAAQDHGERRRR